MNPIKKILLLSSVVLILSSVFVRHDASAEPKKTESYLLKAKIDGAKLVPVFDIKEVKFEKLTLASGLTFVSLKAPGSSLSTLVSSKIEFYAEKKITITKAPDVPERYLSKKFYFNYALYRIPEPYRSQKKNKSKPILYSA